MDGGGAILRLGGLNTRERVEHVSGMSAGSHHTEQNPEQQAEHGGHCRQRYPTALRPTCYVSVHLLSVLPSLSIA
ncbi:MAG: hypothetical protein QOJ31_783 [Gaiellales bacterium]|jgi:hypothetical protein|nr:hypothetical protein [Gaiellales bacterium]